MRRFLHFYSITKRLPSLNGSPSPLDVCTKFWTKLYLFCFYLETLLALTKEPHFDRKQCGHLSTGMLTKDSARQESQQRPEQDGRRPKDRRRDSNDRRQT